MAKNYIYKIKTDKKYYWVVGNITMHRVTHIYEHNICYWHILLLSIICDNARRKLCTQNLQKNIFIFKRATRVSMLTLCTIVSVSTLNNNHINLYFYRAPSPLDFCHQLITITRIVNLLVYSLIIHLSLCIIIFILWG